MRPCKKVAYANTQAAIIDIKKEYDKGNTIFPQSYYKCPICNLYHLTTQQNLDNQILKILTDKIQELQTKIENQKKELKKYLH